MKRKVWYFMVSFVSITTMFLLIGWYTFENMTNQIFLKGMIDVAKTNGIDIILEDGAKAGEADNKALHPSQTPAVDVNLRIAPVTIVEMLDPKPVSPPSDYQTVKKEVEERVKKQETKAVVPVQESTAEKPKKQVALTKEKVSEIEKKVAPSDRAAAIGIVTSSASYQEAISALQAGNSKKAKEILSKTLSASQKAQLWSYYSKYAHLLYE